MNRMNDVRPMLSGFGNQHASEALAGALPVGRNSPNASRMAFTPS